MKRIPLLIIALLISITAVSCADPTDSGSKTVIIVKTMNESEYGRYTFNEDEATYFGNLDKKYLDNHANEEAYRFINDTDTVKVKMNNKQLYLSDKTTAVGLYTAIAQTSPTTVIYIAD